MTKTLEELERRLSEARLMTTYLGTREKLDKLASDAIAALRESEQDYKKLDEACLALQKEAAEQLEREGRLKLDHEAVAVALEVSQRHCADKINDNDVEYRRLSPLIAAAPDLLEALQECIDFVEVHSSGEAREIYLRARAAIKKATGNE